MPSFDLDYQCRKIDELEDANAQLDSAKKYISAAVECINNSKNQGNSEKIVMKMFSLSDKITVTKSLITQLKNDLKSTAGRVYNQELEAEQRTEISK